MALEPVEAGKPAVYRYIPVPYRHLPRYVVSEHSTASEMADGEGNACWITTMPPGVPQPTLATIDLRVRVFTITFTRKGAMTEHHAPHTVRYTKPVP